jgi:hypothetical protein
MANTIVQQLFPNTAKVIHNLGMHISDSIRDTPQCYRFSADEALKLDSTVIREFIKACTDDFEIEQLDRRAFCTSLDVRTHFLMPNFYPCIPGWHCDDFYRPKGQPDFEGIDKYSPKVHYCCVIGSDNETPYNSMPKFLSDEIFLRYDPRNVYSSINCEIENILRATTLNYVEINNQDIVKFGHKDLHRGTVATRQGWRVFMRLTFSRDREPKNILRTQSQVYLKENFGGW